MSPKIIQTVSITSLINLLLLTTTPALAQGQYSQICSNSAVSIPDTEPTGISQTLSIGDSGQITDMNIKLDLTHGHIGELTILLKHGTDEIILLDQPTGETNKGCLGQDIVDLTIDDEGTLTLENDCLTNKPAYDNTNSYQPNGSLNLFDGMDINGDWILTVIDSYDYNQTVGTLDKWCVEYLPESHAQLSFEHAPNTTLPFPDTVVGGTAHFTFTITEQGLDDLTISASITGEGMTASLGEQVLPEDFVIEEPNPPTTILAIGETATFKVACTPSTGDTSIAQLVLTTNIPTLPTITYPLSCKGLSANYSAEFESQSIAEGSTIDFGNVDVGDWLEKTISMSNGSNDAELKLWSATTTGWKNEDFSITTPASFPHTISTNSTNDFTIKCAPSSKGTLQPKLVLETSDQDNRQIEYQLKCKGMAAVYQSAPISPSDSLRFGTALQNNVVEKTFTISNSGNKNLEVSANIDGVGAGVFTVTLSLSVIPRNGSADITVQCQPNNLETYLATLKLTTNDPSQPLIEHPLSCSGTNQVEPLYDSTPVSPGGTLDMGTTNKGTPVQNQFQILEMGNKALKVAIPPEAITGTEKNDFQLIEPVIFPIIIQDGGEPVTVTLQCTPLGYGQRQATLQFISTDENDNPTSVFPNPSYTLTCEATPPVYGSNRPSMVIGFSNLAVGETVVKTLRVDELGGQTDLEVGLATPYITGTHQDNFRIISPTSFPITVTAGGLERIKIECQPSVVGLNTATLYLTSDDPIIPNPTYGLECIGDEIVGIGYGSMPASGSTIDFGNTPLGMAAVKTLQIQEVGTAVLDVSNPQITGTHADEFSLVNESDLPFYIQGDSAAGTQVGIDIQCIPTAGGERTAILQLTSTDSSNSLPTYQLKCTGLVPGYASTPAPNSTINFGNTVINTAVTKTLEISETGNTTLELSSATITGSNAGDFSIISPTTVPVTIADGGANVIATLQCQPTAAGTRIAQLQIATNDPAQPLVSYDLECVGTVPLIPGYASTPAPNSTINFGNTVINTAVTKTIEISETGNTTLELSSATISGANAGDFSIISPTTFPVTIADGGANVIATLQCQPTAEGSRTAQLQIATNDPAQPLVSYDLECSGTIPLIPGYASTPVPSSTINFGNTVINTAVTKTLEISETGNTTLQIVRNDYRY